MEAILAFTIAFIFSFIGTIPPGTLNLTIIQLGLENKIAVAWRFALAAAIIEYPYAWLAVTFESIILSSSAITEHFQLIAGIVMVTLGIFNLLTFKNPTSLAIRFNESGFRRGILLALLNPLAVPYWLAMTAYIQNS